MALGDALTLITLALAVLVATPFVGRYIHRVMEGERTFLSPVLRPVERGIYRICGVDETSEQTWKAYAVSVLVMAIVAIVAGYVVLRLQDVLPLNPGAVGPQTPDLAFNTPVSFATLHAGFVAVVVETPDSERQPFDRTRDTQETVDDAVDLGADVVRIEADDVVSGLAQVARARHATHLVVPFRSSGGLKRFLERPLADQLIERLPELEVHVVGAKPAP